jgi:hypothetical protein
VAPLAPRESTPHPPTPLAGTSIAARAAVRKQPSERRRLGATEQTPKPSKVERAEPRKRREERQKRQFALAHQSSRNPCHMLLVDIGGGAHALPPPFAPHTRKTAGLKKKRRSAKPPDFFNGRNTKKTGLWRFSCLDLKTALTTRAADCRRTKWPPRHLCRSAISCWVSPQSQSAGSSVRGGGAFLIKLTRFAC